MATATSAFSSDEQAVLERTLDSSGAGAFRYDRAAFDIDQTAAHIRRGGFRCVALQFPDAQLPAAEPTVRDLEAALRKGSGADEEVDLFVSARALPQRRLQVAHRGLSSWKLRIGKLQRHAAEAAAPDVRGGLVDVERGAVVAERTGARRVEGALEHGLLVGGEGGGGRRHETHSGLPRGCWARDKQAANRPSLLLRTSRATDRAY